MVSTPRSEVHRLRPLTALPFYEILAVTSTWAAAPFGFPNARWAPGAVNPAVIQADIGETICVRGYTRSIRPPVSYTEPLKRRQLREYGYTDRHIWHYEEDHLVPLEVSGAPRDPRNLWSEPRYGFWNAARKDHLGNTLHYLVCKGRLPLRAAQTVFEQNWTAGYRRYIASRHRVGRRFRRR